MRGMLNDVNTNFKGRLEVVDVAESKKEFCRVLGCKRCLKTDISFPGKRFGVVYPEIVPSDQENIVTMINNYNNPEFLGNYIIFGMTNNGKLTSLTIEEINYLLQNFAYSEYEDGRGKYCLWWVG